MVRLFMEWRRERDSNPRDPFGAYAISSRAPSTTRPSLQQRDSTGGKMDTNTSNNVFVAPEQFRRASPRSRGVKSALSDERAAASEEFALLPLRAV
ncbi:MAG: hypothetical protein Greene041662_988 [Candidatus Peregrinibacteria bacterium Greene0416_62]|nr:MAG: hypothetical protein Greene041662_988 [Candidatus Peregrinibacteria bacterium Greene0416_62]